MRAWGEVTGESAGVGEEVCSVGDGEGMGSVLWGEHEEKRMMRKMRGRMKSEDARGRGPLLPREEEIF